MDPLARQRTEHLKKGKAFITAITLYPLSEDLHSCHMSLSSETGTKTKKFLMPLRRDIRVSLQTHLLRRKLDSRNRQVQLCITSISTFVILTVLYWVTGQFCQCIIKWLSLLLWINWRDTEYSYRDFKKSQLEMFRRPDSISKENLIQS